MSESKEAKKIKTIAFRLTDEEYARAESAAIAAGDETPSNWCRTLVLAEADAGEGTTKNQRLIYEEIARVRCLVPFDLLAVTNTSWQKQKAAGGNSSDLRPIWLRR